MLLIYFIDFSPRHFHFFRERLLGEFGSSFQSPLMFADRAQYASPFLVPGRIRSLPSLAYPACPYSTVRVRPVALLVIVLLNLGLISAI